MELSSPRKLIVMPCAIKGGVGKTTLLTSLLDYYVQEKINVMPFDCDTENRAHGSLHHFCRAAVTKIDIRTEEGLDLIIAEAIEGNSDIIIADLAASSGKMAFRWFDEMYEQVEGAGIRFLSIGIVTSEVASIETVFDWANAIQRRSSYLIVRNHRNGDYFGTLETEIGQNFLARTGAPIIDMEARLEKIQHVLDLRGLSLRAALDDLDIPAVQKMRIRGYLNRMNAQFSLVTETLLP
jgi:CobQ/CobB/MinD/ParA nucleotide binding domain